MIITRSWLEEFIDISKISTDEICKTLNGNEILNMPLYLSVMSGKKIEGGQLFVEFDVEDIVRSALVKEYIINKYKLGLNG
jgi:hypothetical protein